MPNLLVCAACFVAGGAVVGAWWWWISHKNKVRALTAQAAKALEAVKK